MVHLGCECHVSEPWLLVVLQHIIAAHQSWNPGGACMLVRGKGALPLQCSMVHQETSIHTLTSNQTSSGGVREGCT